VEVIVEGQVLRGEALHSGTQHVRKNAIFGEGVFYVVVVELAGEVPAEGL